MSRRHTRGQSRTKTRAKTGAKTRAHDQGAPSDCVIVHRALAICVIPFFGIGAFPQGFAATIAGAAPTWQMGVWPKIARHGNGTSPCLGTSTDLDRAYEIRELTALALAPNICYLDRVPAGFGSGNLPGFAPYLHANPVTRSVTGWRWLL
jgi:hypothetical protein